LPSDSTLTLYIPDLFGFQSTLSQLSQEELSQLPVTRFPVLEKWLSRGTIKKSKTQHDILSSEFGLTVDENKDKPYAALSLIAEHREDIKYEDKYWLRADPVYLYADRDTLLLSAHEELCLNQQEADNLVDAINSHFKDEPWTLYSVEPHRWYLALEKNADMVTHRLADVMGKNIYHYEAVGEDALYWQTITNEIQMLLHSSNVNFERASRNNYSANSLWLWGGGTLPANNALNASHDVIITNDILFKGVGYHCGLNVIALDNDFDDEIKNVNSFVVLDSLTGYIMNSDLYRFMQTLAEIEKDFLVRCNELLLNNEIDKIVLIIDNNTSLSINKKQLRHWWKRVKPFVNFNYG